MSIRLFAGVLAIAMACGSTIEYPHTVAFHTDDGLRYLSVAIADEPSEQAEGLMGVDDLPADAGMAFLFERPSRESFWMKNTPTPLSIAFIGEDGRIFSITDMRPCESDPCPSYGPVEPIIYAVEAHRGWFEANGIRQGDRVEVRHRTD